MSSIYSSKLEAGSGVLNLAALCAKYNGLADDLLSYDKTPVLCALGKAFVAYAESEITDDDKAEKAKLEVQKADCAKHDPAQVLAEEIVKAKGDVAKVMALMESLPTRKAEHATKLAEIDAKLADIAEKPISDALKTFASNMQSNKAKPTGNGTKTTHAKVPHVGVVVKCPYDRNRRAYHVTIVSESDYRVWKAYNGQNKIIAYDSTENDNAPKITSLSVARKICDCLRKKLALTEENLTKQTLGVGTHFPEDTGREGGTYAEIVSHHPAAWETTEREKNQKAAEKA